MSAARSFPSARVRRTSACPAASVGGFGRTESGGVFRRKCLFKCSWFSVFIILNSDYFIRKKNERTLMLPENHLLTGAFTEVRVISTSVSGHAAEV